MTTTPPPIPPAVRFRCAACGALPWHPCGPTTPGEPAPEHPHPARQARADAAAAEDALRSRARRARLTSREDAHAFAATFLPRED